MPPGRRAYIPAGGSAGIMDADWLMLALGKDADLTALARSLASARGAITMQCPRHDAAPSCRGRNETDPK